MDIMKMGKNPNYLGSWDLYEMPNNEITATISKIVDEEVINNGKKEGCTVAYFAEDIKPMILNVTNKKTLTKLYKFKDSQKFVGKRITIGYEQVKAFGKISDALRIKNVVPRSTTVSAEKCEICNAEITAVGNMTAEQTAKYTLAKYGKKLCAKCATAENKKTESEKINENNEDKN